MRLVKPMKEPGIGGSSLARVKKEPDTDGSSLARVKMEPEWSAPRDYADASKTVMLHLRTNNATETLRADEVTYVESQRG